MWEKESYNVKDISFTSDIVSQISMVRMCEKELVMISCVSNILILCHIRMYNSLSNKDEKVKKYC